MSAPKFTPGPWIAHQSTRYRGPIGYAWDIATGEATWDPSDYDRDEGTMGTWNYPDDYSRIATTSDEGSGNNAQANAALIAAAPELYAALERCIPLLEQLGDFIGNGPLDPNNPGSLGERCDAILQARNALGKAVPDA